MVARRATVVVGVSGMTGRATDDWTNALPRPQVLRECGDNKVVAQLGEYDLSLELEIELARKVVRATWREWRGTVQVMWPVNVVSREGEVA